jgi:hypothetical protein
MAVLHGTFCYPDSEPKNIKLALEYGKGGIKIRLFTSPTVNMYIEFFLNKAALFAPPPHSQKQTR